MLNLESLSGEEQWKLIKRVESERRSARRYECIGRMASTFALAAALGMGSMYAISKCMPKKMIHEYNAAVQNIIDSGRYLRL